MCVFVYNECIGASVRLGLSRQVEDANSFFQGWASYTCYVPLKIIKAEEKEKTLNKT